MGLCTRLPNLRNELFLNIVIKVVAFHTSLHKNADRSQGTEWDRWANRRVVRNVSLVPSSVKSQHRDPHL